MSLTLEEYEVLPREQRDAELMKLFCALNGDTMTAEQKRFFEYKPQEQRDAAILEQVLILNGGSMSEEEKRSFERKNKGQRDAEIWDQVSQITVGSGSEGDPYVVANEAALSGIPSPSEGQVASIEAGGDSRLFFFNEGTWKESFGGYNSFMEGMIQPTRAWMSFMYQAYGGGSLGTTMDLSAFAISFIDTASLSVWMLAAQAVAPLIIDFSGGSLTTVEVDALLSAVASDGGANVTLNISGGTIGTPTGGAANADILTIEGAGGGVTFNP